MLDLQMVPLSDFQDVLVLFVSHFLGYVAVIPIGTVYIDVYHCISIIGSGGN